MEEMRQQLPQTIEPIRVRLPDGRIGYIIGGSCNGTFRIYCDGAHYVAMASEVEPC